MVLQSIFKKQKALSALEGKWALITGAAQGIGLATALELAEAGCHLILTDINSQQLEEAAFQIKTTFNNKLHFYTVDVADKEQVQNLAQEITTTVGQLDLLINNAGIGHHGSLEETTLETWQRLININLLGPLHHIYAFLPLMKQQEQGHIINVSSGQAFFKLPTWGAYAGIKMAIGAISEILHYELKTYNINVTTVYPYMVHTGFYKDVETQSLGSKLSMKLLPLYSQKPATVAKIIVKAIHKKKRIEMVNPLNHLAKNIHTWSPLSNAFSQTINFFLNNPSQTIKNSKWFAQLENFTNLISSISYGALGDVGFRMEETMTGEHEFVDGQAGKLPMEFKVIWGSKNLVDWSNPFDKDFMSNSLEGTVTIEGLCQDAPCTGRLELRYFSEQKIKYCFDFEVKGKTYQYRGEKRNIYPWNLPYSHTCCFGEVRLLATNELISTSMTHFHWDTLPDFLGSFELVRT